jgi:aminoglycoside phosphotransferase
MNRLFAAALSDAFPDREVDSVHAAGPSWNAANETARVEFVDGDAVYLKVACDDDGSRITRERAVVAYVGAFGTVPVPTVVASDPDAAVPYLATAPVTGEPLLSVLGEATVDEKVAMARAVGRALAGVHAHRFDRHGHVVGGGADGLDLEPGSWTDVLTDTIREMRSRAPSERFRGHFGAVIDAVEANRDLLDAAPATLLHGDPAVPNCFVDGTVGLLDWEIAHVGDPVRDLHRTVDQQFATPREGAPEAYVTAFHEGYRERADGLPEGVETRRPIYEVVRLLGVSGHFENYVEHLDEPPEEFASWVEAEMRRRLDRL